MGWKSGPFLFAAFAAFAAAAETAGHVPGDRIGNASVVLPNGGKADLAQLLGPRGMVIITSDADCPVAQRYRPRMQELAARYGKSGIAFVVLDMTPAGDRPAAEPDRPTSGTSPVVITDPTGALVDSLLVATTAEAFVIDRASTLRYRGAIDDQYGITHQKAAPTRNWLADALESVIGDEPVAVDATDAPGCAVAHEPKPAAKQQRQTYHNRVSRIIQSKCQACHRSKGLAPMPLETFAEVYPRRAAIAAMVGAGIMPPWSARAGVGKWSNDRSLSARDKADLLAWIGSGAPEGDPRDAPLPARFERGWNIGRPDAVIAIPEPLVVPAQGVLAYKDVYVQTQFGEDKWVTAVEIRPTQPAVVHHIIVVLEEPREKPRINAAMEFFGITVPGSLGMRFPEGTGKRLPKGAWLRFQIHYQPNGKEVVDRSEVAFRFATTRVREVATQSALSYKFAIPPYASNHQVAATYTFKKPGQLLSLFPHMHLRGKAFRYELQTPDGSRRVLLDVPRFDFGWQSYYEFKTPVDVPAGARLTAIGWFDNSSNNPWNPDPSKEVRWGLQTFDEMMVGYFDFLPR